MNKRFLLKGSLLNSELDTSEIFSLDELMVLNIKLKHFFPSKKVLHANKVYT